MDTVQFYAGKVFDFNPNLRIHTVVVIGITI